MQKEFHYHCLHKASTFTKPHWNQITYAASSFVNFKILPALCPRPWSFNVLDECLPQWTNIYFCSKLEKQWHWISLPWHFAEFHQGCFYWWAWRNRPDESEERSVCYSENGAMWGEAGWRAGEGLLITKSLPQPESGSVRKGSSPYRTFSEHLILGQIFSTKLGDRGEWSIIIFWWGNGGTERLPYLRSWPALDRTAGHRYKFHLVVSHSEDLPVNKREKVFTLRSLSLFRVTFLQYKS